MGKILYFVKGVASQNDKEQARLAGAVIRDANAWHKGDFIEQCDEVMGDAAIVPEPYRHLLKQPVKASTGKRKKNAADS